MGTNDKTNTEVVVHQVPFHGMVLQTLEADGERWVAPKPVVEYLGLSWGSQHRKLTSERERWRVCSYEHPSAGGAQEMLCIPLRMYASWLNSINSAKIPDLEKRARLNFFQEFSNEALYQFWFHGSATHESVKAAITSEDVERIKDASRQTGKTVIEAVDRNKGYLIGWAIKHLKRPLEQALEAGLGTLRLIHERLDRSQRVVDKVCTDVAVTRLELQETKDKIIDLDRVIVRRIKNGIGPDGRATMVKLLARKGIPPELRGSGTASELTHYAKVWFPEHGYLVFPPGGGSNRIAYEYDASGFMPWWHAQGRFVFDRYWSKRDQKWKTRRAGQSSQPRQSDFQNPKEDKHDE